MGKSKRHSRTAPVVVAAPSAFPDPYTNNYNPRVNTITHMKNNRKSDITKQNNTSEKSEKEGKLIKMKKELISSETELDFDKIFKEVKSMGSTQFTGYQKKIHKEEVHTAMTGLKKKRQSIPKNILFGMIEKNNKRENKREKEEKDAGIVSDFNGRRKRKREENDRDFTKKSKKMNSLHGPSPNSVGFMKKGVLRLKEKF